MKLIAKNFYGILMDYREVYGQFRSRTLQLQIFCFILMLIIIIKLVQLQVVNYEKHQRLSNKNRLSLVSLAPYRGRILDRNGVVLAHNKVSYQLQINPSLKRSKRKQLIKTLSDSLNLDSKELEDNYRTKVRVLGTKKMIPLSLLNDKQTTNFANQSFRYSDFSLGFAVVREYPFNEHAVHLIGYVGAVNESDLNDWNLFDNINQAKAIQYVGKTGVERYYDKHLRGKEGYETIELNSRRQKVRTISIEPPQDGKDLQLSIDINLQTFTDYLIAPFKGAIVMLDVQNGDVLAMSSAPNFDNNLLVNNLGKGFTKLSKRNDKPFLNRATHGLYPPASTIKPFVALAGLEYKTLSPQKKIYAGPYFLVPGDKRKFHDWKKKGHGWVNLNKAMAQSSDVYFYKLAYEMGIDKMYDYLVQFPFGVETGIDLPGESSGILPNRVWKSKRFGNKWLPGDSVIFSIGQGYFLTTPLQLTVGIASIANHGQILKPSLARESQEVTRVDLYNEKSWRTIIKTLENTIHEPYGTAYKSSFGANYRYAGKTGTSQIISLAQDPIKRDLQKKKLDKNLRDHSIFVGFAPVNNPRVAITVLVENGESGSQLAAPLARVAMDKYFELF